MSASAELSLQTVSTILESISRSASDPYELSEVAFLELARVAVADIFELGLFESNSYRTLLRVVEGSRVENRDISLVNDETEMLTWVRDSGQPLFFSDFGEEKGRLPAVKILTESKVPSSGLFVPLKLGERVLGVISLRSDQNNAFTRTDKELLSILASSIAPALAATSLTGEVESLTLQMLLIQEFSRLLMTLEPLSERMKRIVALLSQALEIDRISLYELVDGAIELRADTYNTPDGEDPIIPELVKKTIDTGLVQSLTMEGGTGVEGSAMDPNSEFAFPLNIVHHRLGALHLCCPDGKTIKAEQLRLLEMVSQQLAFAILEARNYAQHQQEAWITTVLLEVARHAAEPGDPVSALQAVLQLATLLVGTEWILLLTPESIGGTLQITTSAGLRRQQTFALAELEIKPETLGIDPPFRENELTLLIDLPAPMDGILKDDRALGMILSDGHDMLGLLLMENEQISGKQPSLMAGIAHQISLRLENTRLIEKAALQRSLERELAMAREIQVSFLPPAIPQVSGWELGVTWRVAREVGGDFYDFIPLPAGENGERIGIVIADVADKGVPAALYMALSRTLLRSVAMEILDPGTCLRRVNRQLIADTRADLFVSTFYCIWEPDHGVVKYANAGHNPPLLFTPGQRGELLREHGMVLGVQAESEYKTRSVELESDQLLVLYTDGVTDAMDANEDFFGIHRLESLVLGLSNWQAQHVADSIQERVLQFTGRRELFDDLTAMTLHH